MKRILGLTMVMALMIPVGVLAAGPAGAAGGTTCKTLTGTGTVTPGLGTTKKNQTIVAVSAIGGCTGGGVTGGTGKATNVTKNANCTGLAGIGVKSTITQVITWNTKATSTLTGTTVTGPKVAQATIKLTVTKGLFVGLHATQIISFTPAKGGGSCTDKAPLKKLTIKVVTPLVIK
jgi:hypothetical protein